MTEKEHGSVAMGDSREEDDMPERIWAGDFDGQGFGHCVAGMQGGLYEEYVRAALARPAQETVAWRWPNCGCGFYTGAAPQPVINPTHSQVAGTPGLLTDPAPSEHVKAKWAGDQKILRDGALIDILCTDPSDPNVPGRRACWVRHWPEGRDFPVYRSCDLSDLEEVSAGDFDKLSDAKERKE